MRPSLPNGKEFSSSLYLPGRGVFDDETKNETSTRTIKIPIIAMDTLRQYKKWQLEQQLKIGDKWIDSNRLFTTWDGKPIHPDTLTHWFEKFVAKNNLPDVCLHSLRHTNATLQIAGGVSLPTISKRLGHANTTTTAKIYVHAIQSADEAASEVLENMLTPNYKRIKKRLCTIPSRGNVYSLFY